MSFEIIERMNQIYLNNYVFVYSNLFSVFLFIDASSTVVVSLEYGYVVFNEVDDLWH